MKKLACFAAAVPGVVLMLWTVPGYARTWFVNPGGTGDAPTVQAAIDSASAGDEIVLADGTFTGAGNREVDFKGKSVTVTSQSGHPETCIIDCEGGPASPRFGFWLANGETRATVLEGITVHGGYYPGGAAIIHDNSSPSIINCVFSNNTASTYGGGAIGCGQGSPLISHCKFENNTAPVGGAIYCNNSSTVIEFCEFISDSAGTYGGAIASEHGTLTVTDSRFVGNRAGDSGGAINSFYDDEVMLTGLTLESNKAASLGGAIELEDVVMATIEGCSLVSNTANSGGAITSIGPLTVNYCVFSYNTAVLGGGAVLDLDGVLAGANNTLVGNSGPSGGTFAIGGSGSLTLSNSIIAFGPEGMPVYCAGTPNPDLTCCNVYGNIGDWIGCLAGQLGVNGNISADPAFCGDLGSGNYNLQSDSPCAPGNHPGSYPCGQIGAMPVGCGDSPTRKASWGELKSLYRD